MITAEQARNLRDSEKPRLKHILALRRIEECIIYAAVNKQSEVLLEEDDLKGLSPKMLSFIDEQLSNSGFDVNTRCDDYNTWTMDICWQP